MIPLLFSWHTCIWPNIPMGNFFFCLCKTHTLSISAIRKLTVVWIAESKFCFITAGMLLQCCMVRKFHYLCLSHFEAFVLKVGQILFWCTILWCTYNRKQKEEKNCYCTKVRIINAHLILIMPLLLYHSERRPQIFIPKRKSTYCIIKLAT